MTGTVDIAIIGGGIMGCATASGLREAGFFGSVTVIERDPTLRDGSTGRSVGGIRLQFSTPENIALSRVTRALVDDLHTRFGSDADISFRGQGYLILATPQGRPILLENAAIQRAAGVDTRILGPSELQSRFPWLNMDGLAAGTMCPAGTEGWCDPASLHALFRKAARTTGVSFLDAGVIDLAALPDGTTLISLSDGKTLSCGRTVIAAGAWSGEIAGFADLRLPVEPRKRFVYVLDCRLSDEQLRRAPLTIDPDGVYMRPEGRHFVCGRSPDPGHEPDPDDLDHIDHEFFDATIWPVLANRIPAFEAIKVINAWAGYYDYNTFDQNAIIGPFPEHPQIFVITGFSGHGIQQAPAAGRALAELIVHGAFQTIDLTRFGFDRLLRNTPYRERNVI